jgi:hypothetical protein
MTTPEQITAGRNIVIRLSWMVICFSAVTILHYNLILGPRKLPEQLIRFALTIWLCYSIYQGSQAARWIAIVLFAIGGVGLIVLVVRLKEMDMFDAISAGVQGATYLVFAGSLLGSAKVIAFMNSQRGQAGEEMR